HHGGDQGPRSFCHRRSGRRHGLAGRLQLPVGVVVGLGGRRGGLSCVMAERTTFSSRWSAFSPPSLACSCSPLPPPRSARRRTINRPPRFPPPIPHCGTSR